MGMYRPILAEWQRDRVPLLERGVRDDDDDFAVEDVSLASDLR
jgi:hypothetical protein